MCHLCLILQARALRWGSLPQVEANRWASLAKATPNGSDLAVSTIDLSALIVSGSPIVWFRRNSRALSLKFEKLKVPPSLGRLPFSSKPWKSLAKEPSSCEVCRISLVRPRLRASSAPTSRPLERISRARLGPRSWTRRAPPPQPQQTPTFIWTNPIFADSIRTVEEWDHEEGLVVEQYEILG